MSLTFLLSIVHFRIQPAIENLLTQVQEEEIPFKIAEQILPLRLRRKRLAGLCLFIVITIVLLGLQVFSRFGVTLTAFLIGMAGLFAWRVYKSPVRFGWF